MSKAKMTAKDYEQAYESLKSDMEVLKTRIAMRLLTLAKRFPDAPIQQKGDTIIKAMSINSAIAISKLELEYQIEMIRRIENWIAEQHPVKQTKINF
jgi:hypothetical protein